MQKLEMIARRTGEAKYVEENRFFRAYMTYIH